MDSQRQKWVNLIFASCAGLVAYVLFELSFKLVGIYDLEARVQDIDLIIRIASVVIGAGLFFGLYRHDTANQFTNEVVAELSRVTWPTSGDTYKATIAVLIMVLISGAFLGGMDTVWTWALNLIL